MLQIGDIVHLKPFGETLYTITGVMRTPGPQYEPVKDPENDNRFTYRRPIVNLYAVDGGKCHWVEEDIIPTSDHNLYPPSRFAIGDEVIVGRDDDTYYHVIAVMHEHGAYNYMLANMTGSRPLVKRHEQDVIPATQYSLF